MMANVARIFNDAQGAEVTQRTGRNPAYQYLSLGCSRAQEQRMLQFALAQRGKPFSNIGMARSLVMPRRTDEKSWCAAVLQRPCKTRSLTAFRVHRFCAELVAAILQKGNLLSSDSNPGAATPHSLYKMYSKHAAATANPYTLRTVQNTSLVQQGMYSRVPSDALCFDAVLARPRASLAPSNSRRRSDSPPRAAFKLLSGGGPQTAAPGLTLSLTSLGGRR